MNKLKPIIALLCVVGFFAFCVYAHRVREGWTDTKAEQQLQAVRLERNIKDSALQYIAKDAKDSVVLAKVAQDYPQLTPDAIATMLHMELPSKKEVDSNATKEGGE